MEEITNSLISALPVTSAKKVTETVKPIKTVVGAYFAGKTTAGANLDLTPHKAFPGKEKTIVALTIAITAIQRTGFHHRGEPAVHHPIPVHSATGTVIKTLTASPVSYVVTTIARTFILEQATKTTAVFVLMEGVPTMEVIGPILGIIQVEVPSYLDVRQILVFDVAQDIGHALWEEETAAVMMTARGI